LEDQAVHQIADRAAAGYAIFTGDPPPSSPLSAKHREVTPGFSQSRRDAPAVIERAFSGIQRVVCYLNSGARVAGRNECLRDEILDREARALQDFACVFC
jgi:hypothetical protein